MLLAKRALIVASVLAIAAPAAAQRELNIERLQPPLDRHGFLGFPGTFAPGPGRWNFGLVFNYSKNPLVVSSSGQEFNVVRHRMGGNIVGQVGIGPRLGVALDLPLVYHQTGRSDVLRDDGPMGLTSGGWGDPRLVLRYRFYGQDSAVERERPEGPGIGAVAAVTAPIGNDDAFVAEESAVTDLAVNADFHVLGAGAGVILGWRHRFDKVQLGTVTFRDELSFGLGLKMPIPVTPGLVAHLALRGAFDARFESSARTAVEGDLGISYTHNNVTISGAVGTGFTGGVGTPAIRGLLALDWAPRVGDADGDTIPDNRDQCVHLPEDFDGFEDSDGCFDPDNDNDFVPDPEDRCPNEAAEEGHDLDEDGCTDEVTDRDQDGVGDDTDACPTEAEDRDGYQDDDGCPDPDNDADGVPDVNDSCPGEPEDRDGFQDDDGCPDPDNDGDGRPDSADECPNGAEDADGFEDEDGCPDPDNDRDGVVDADDQCADGAENINGVDDGDGCPDRGGRVLWRVDADGESVRLTGNVALTEDGIAGRSVAAVDQLARHLIARWPDHFQIAVHAAEDAARAALVAALVERGVPAGRVTVVVDPQVPGARMVVTRVPQPETEAPAAEAAPASGAP